MRKHLWAPFAAVALVASGLHVLPAGAATEIPEVVQIDDPAGDANFLNNQDNANLPQGDNVTGDDVGSATDIMKVWFTNDAENISVHIQTEAVPQDLAYTAYFRVAANPEDPEAAVGGCVRWVGILNGTADAYQGEDGGFIEDTCIDDGPTEGTITVDTGPEESGIVTITGPRSESPLLGDGGTVIAPYVVVRVLTVGEPFPGSDVGGVTSTFAALGQIDNTVRGTDYTITSGEASPSPSAEPGKKKGCPKKGKGKKAKKGKKKGCPQASPSPSPSASPTGSPSASPSASPTA